MRSNGIGSPHEVHLGPEDLAVLAERGRDALPPGAIEHLAGCRTCMASYADAVRYRSAWVSMPASFRDASAASPAHPAVARRRWMGPAAWIAAAACLVVLVAFLADRASFRGAAPRRSEPPLVAVLEEASSRGLVLPGGEAGADRAGSRYRSGTAATGSETQVVERLRTAYERDRRHAALYDVAAGLVATGQVDLAHDYISEGLAASPEDARLLTLDGVLAYRLGDLAGAETRLREAQRIASRDLTVTLDLGLVVAESHGVTAAAPYLRQVTQRAPGSPLAARARAALARAPR